MTQGGAAWGANPLTGWIFEQDEFHVWLVCPNCRTELSVMAGEALTAVVSDVLAHTCGA